MNFTKEENERLHKIADVMSKAKELEQAMHRLGEEDCYTMTKDLSKRGFLREQPYLNELQVIVWNIEYSGGKLLADVIGKQIDSKREAN